MSKWSGKRASNRGLTDEDGREDEVEAELGPPLVCQVEGNGEPETGDEHVRHELQT